MMWETRYRTSEHIQNTYNITNFDVTTTFDRTESSVLTLFPLIRDNTTLSLPLTFPACLKNEWFENVRRSEGLTEQTRIHIHQAKTKGRTDDSDSQSTPLGKNEAQQLRPIWVRGFVTCALFDFRFISPTRRLLLITHTVGREDQQFFFVSIFLSFFTDDVVTCDGAATRRQLPFHSIFMFR